LEELVTRAKVRVLKREAKRQKNLQAIAAKAAKEMPESVSEMPVEQDWVSRFLEDCQDVSNEDMQTVWGRILAGEVAKPGTFSYRTLFAVKMLRPEVANLFTRLCSFVWLRDGVFTPVIRSPDFFLPRCCGSRRYSRP